MHLRCQSCGEKFSFGEFVTLPDVCHSCHRAGRQVPERTRAIIDARGERNVGWLMIVTGLALCGVALLFEARPDAAILSKWKVALAGLGVLALGLTRVRSTNRRLRDLEKNAR
jgi:hypothetical protein